MFHGNCQRQAKIYESMIMALRDELHAMRESEAKLLDRIMTLTGIDVIREFRRNPAAMGPEATRLPKNVRSAMPGRVNNFRPETTPPWVTEERKKAVSDASALDKAVTNIS